MSQKSQQQQQQQLQTADKRSASSQQSAKDRSAQNELVSRGLDKGTQSFQLLAENSPLIFFPSFLKNFLSNIYYFLNVVSLKIHYSCFYHIHFISTKMETFIATLYTYYMYIFFMVVLYREGKQFFQIVRNHVLHYENERILT